MDARGNPTNLQQLDYALAHSLPVPDYLRELERRTHLKTLAPQMMTDPLQGRLLAWLARLHRPRRVLEVGTFTGYAALCLAEGLPPDGDLHTVDGNPETAWLARNAFAASPYAGRIHAHRGQALDVLPTLPGPWDLIYLDADKLEYVAYFDLLRPRLAAGALVLADNVLWDGKTADPDATEPKAAALQNYNERLRADPEMDVLVLPLRDGLSMARYRSGSEN